MSITAISRDWGTTPAIVRITTTDNLNTVSTAGYLANQEEVITELNNGAFEWLPDDNVLVSASDGAKMFHFVNGDFDTLVPNESSGGEPAGANGSVQYNNNGAFGGTNLSYNGTYFTAENFLLSTQNGINLIGGETINVSGSNYAQIYSGVGGNSIMLDSDGVAISSTAGVSIASPGSAVEIGGVFTQVLINGFTIPTTDGTAGQALVTDGSKVLSFATVGGSGSPGGTTGQLQYNDNGSFGGTVLKYDPGTPAFFTDTESIIFIGNGGASAVTISDGFAVSATSNAFITSLEGDAAIASTTGNLYLTGGTGVTIQIGLVSWAFPTADGSNGDAIITDGNGTLSFGKPFSSGTGDAGGQGATANVTVTNTYSGTVPLVTIASSDNPVTVNSATVSGTTLTVNFSADPGTNCTINYIIA